MVGNPRATSRARLSVCIPARILSFPVVLPINLVVLQGSPLSKLFDAPTLLEFIDEFLVLPLVLRPRLFR